MFKILQGDCIEQLKTIETESIQAVITDPPYNVNMAMWDKVGTGKDYAEWCRQWGTECFHILKPGGAILSFSAARMYHWLAVGIEQCGFITRDMIEWIYFASKAKGKNLKPAHEPIYYAVKPPVDKIVFNFDDCRIPMTNKQRNDLEKLYLPNQPIKARTDIWSKGGSCCGKSYNSVVGKKAKQWVHTANEPHPGGRDPNNIITSYSLDHIVGENIDYPLNVIDVKKPRGKESIPDHPTQKPIALMAWLIKLVTNENDIVVDPFAGSGTTGEAALILKRNCIMIEREENYIDILKQRLTTLPNKEKIK